MNIIASIENIIDYTGHYGPIITFAITCLYLLLVNKHLSFIVFLGGFWINLILNNLLKSVIREPRPSNQVPFIDKTFAGPQVYGMPSGHAQICFYNFAFLYLCKPLPLYNSVLATSLLVSLTTLFQRLKFRRHTIQQLLIGSLVGLSVGYSTFTLMKNYDK